MSSRVGQKQEYAVPEATAAAPDVLHRHSFLKSLPGGRESLPPGNLHIPSINLVRSPWHDGAPRTWWQGSEVTDGGLVVQGDRLIGIGFQHHFPRHLPFLNPKAVTMGGAGVNSGRGCVIRQYVHLRTSTQSGIAHGVPRTATCGDAAWLLQRSAYPCQDPGIPLLAFHPTRPIHSRIIVSASSMVCRWERNDRHAKRR